MVSHKFYYHLIPNDLKQAFVVTNHVYWDKKIEKIDISQRPSLFVCVDGPSARQRHKTTFLLHPLTFEWTQNMMGCINDDENIIFYSKKILKRVRSKEDISEEHGCLMGTWYLTHTPTCQYLHPWHGYGFWQSSSGLTLWVMGQRVLRLSMHDQDICCKHLYNFIEILWHHNIAIFITFLLWNLWKKCYLLDITIMNIAKYSVQPGKPGSCRVAGSGACRVGHGSEIWDPGYTRFTRMTRLYY